MKNKIKALLILVLAICSFTSSGCLFSFWYTSSTFSEPTIISISGNCISSANLPLSNLQTGDVLTAEIYNFENYNIYLRIHLSSNDNNLSFELDNDWCLIDDYYYYYNDTFKVLNSNSSINLNITILNLTPEDENSSSSLELIIQSLQADNIPPNEVMEYWNNFYNN